MGRTGLQKKGPNVVESFILSGSTNAGYRHVWRNELSVLSDGVLVLSNEQDVFITSEAQRGMYAKGISMFQPSWENLLNDFVTLYVISGVSSDALALDLFILLGKEERRSIASGQPAAVTNQRVREAALGYNLLATGSTWKTKIAAAFPYRNRDWVAWCDGYIGESEKLRVRLERDGDYQEARLVERVAAPLHQLRKAFASATFPVVDSRSEGGCYIATCLYGDYDAAEVLTLRRWRDLTLARSWIGRLAISLYYSVSPWLVATFGESWVLRRPGRLVVDRFVRHLESR